MRLFIALELPLQVRDRILEWMAPLSPEHAALKWTAPENLHITLRFLGEVDAGPVVRTMRANGLHQGLPVTFTLDRTGTFGRPPSVLWLSGAFSRGVYSIAELLGGIPDEKGERERRKFRPHVTVARARYGHAVPTVSPPAPISGESSRITLISSTLTRSGPVYRSLFSTGSQGAARA